MKTYNAKELEVIIDRYNSVLTDLSMLKSSFLRSVFFKSDGSIFRERVLTCISSEKSYHMFELVKEYLYENENTFDKEFVNSDDFIAIDKFGREILSDSDSLSYFIGGVSYLLHVSEYISRSLNKSRLLKELLLALIEFDMIFWEDFSCTRSTVYNAWQIAVEIDVYGAKNICQIKGTVRELINQIKEIDLKSVKYQNSSLVHMSYDFAINMYRKFLYAGIPSILNELADNNKFLSDNDDLAIQRLFIYRQFYIFVHERIDTFCEKNSKNNAYRLSWTFEQLDDAAEKLCTTIIYNKYQIPIDSEIIIQESVNMTKIIQPEKV